MFCVIYKFTVKKGQEEQFQKSWSKVTKAFIDHCDALGSRLHHISDQDYIAYAQWPSRQAWKKAQLPSDIQEGPLIIMRESCQSIETLFELTPIVDHLIDIKSIDNTSSM